MSAVESLPSVSSSNGPANLDIQCPEALGFVSSGLFDILSSATALQLDELPFGVVALALDGTVEAYNTFEARLAGLTPGRVIGRNFFTNVAPCTNNFMVAQRFQTESDLDVIIDYVFTLRMTPKKVRLRLLKRTGLAQMYLVVERRV